MYLAALGGNQANGRKRNAMGGCAGVSGTMRAARRRGGRDASSSPSHGCQERSAPATNRPLRRAMEGPIGTRYVIRHTVNEPPHPHAHPGDDPRDLPHGNRRRQALLVVVGVVLLILWAWWWFETMRRGQMVLARQTRIPGWRFLGLDFLHNYWGVRVWVAGGNPYHVEIGDWRGKYAYPPIALPLFSW